MQICNNGWDVITIDYLTELYKLMPHHMEAVIEAEVGHT